MKTILFFFLIILLAGPAMAQRERLNAVTDSVMREAMVLYKSESASWYGGDIFGEKCRSIMPKVGGYLSYDSGSGMKNIFFSKDADPAVLATIAFPYDNISMATGQLDTVSRKMTKTERDLYTIRKAAVDMINANTDTLFKFYRNISVNPVPVISNGQKKVYALAGPKEFGIVVFGNDYLITFNESNKITAARSLHKNIITIKYDPAKTDKTILSSMHTHLPSSGDFMSATDICTLMLYEKFTTWQSHYVISAAYTSLWDCNKNKLSIMTKEAWDKLTPAEKILPKNQ